MPIYRVMNIVTEETEEHLCSWDEIQSVLQGNPDVRLVPSAPAIVSGVSGRIKPDEGFRDVLRNIKSKHRGSTLDVL